MSIFALARPARVARTTAISLVAFAATLAGSALAIGAADYKSPITEVGPVTKSSISVFRQTDAVTVPQIIKDIVESDTKDGKTFLGQSADLARPAYPDAAKQKPPLWLIPGADEHLMAYSIGKDGNSAGGGGGLVTDEFFAKYGMIMYQPGLHNSHNRTLLTVLVPDSITTVKVKTKAHGKKGKIHTYTPHDNVVVTNLKHTVAVIVNGKKFNLQPRRRR